MTEVEHKPSANDGARGLPPWSNIIPRECDADLAWIEQLKERAEPIPPVARAIRSLITRVEICHFKVERHLRRIIEAIGAMHLDLDPATIGRAHPRSGKHAWKRDVTGRSRIGQEYIWILQSWLVDAPYPEDDPRQISRCRFAAVHYALGGRDPRKDRLVRALIDRLVGRENRPNRSDELEELRGQIERTDICHYAFPDNLVQTVLAIGRLRPVAPCAFVGCGTCGEAQARMAKYHFEELVAWLRDESSVLSEQLGDKTPTKTWLVASLAKTLKEHAGLTQSLVSLQERPLTESLGDDKLLPHRLAFDCCDPSDESRTAVR